MSHKFKGSEISNRIIIEGSFDVNVWYSYDNDTKTTVITKTINYTEEEVVNQKETTDSSTKDIIIRSLKQPTCINAKEDEKTITIEIEKELGIEIVGDTKVKIAIEEDEEPWDILGENEYTDNIDKEIEEINKNYIEENNNEKNTN